jgi:hypothetical protein
MSRACQHCSTVVDDDTRVMCPKCRRRIGAVPAPVQASYDAPPATEHRYDSPLPQVDAPPAFAAPSVPVDAPAYATPASVRATAAVPAPVTVLFDRSVTASTSRLSVLFRLVLALPHLVALYVIAVATGLIVVVAWFTALVTARVPESLYEVIAWTTSYASRVLGYLMLLTDRWPSFRASEGDAVVVRLPGPQRLNRLAVLFRLVLLVPAAFVAEIAGIGSGVVLVVVWLVVLVTGRMPIAAFDATAGVLRYQLRYYGYASLATARYPHGLFGDVDDPTEARSDGPATPPVPANARRLMIAIVALGVVGVVAQSAHRGDVATHAFRHQCTPGSNRTSACAPLLSDTWSSPPAAFESGKTR